jgi:hypothetical protein
MATSESGGGTSVRRGVKIDPVDEGAIDMARLGILLSRPRPIDGVELQDWYSDYVQCPWCGHVGQTMGLNTDFYVDVVCGSCGAYFRA